MLKCSNNCIPCYDFCIYCKHDNNSSEPIGCNLHSEEKYQLTAISCGYCNNFHCFRVRKWKT
jgi:hypothetical protein